ncbi:MAG: hypothetical protein ACWA47_05360 [Brevirhabdus sp.]
MSKLLNGFVLVGFVGTLAACGGSTTEEVVFVEPDPVVAEPTYTGKYK